MTTVKRKSRWWLVAALVIVGLAFALSSFRSCRAHGDLFGRPRPGKARGAPDVLLVVVDTLRADYTTPYGSSARATPFLERLTRDSVVFENAFSTAPWTVPAMYSMMTGLYPTEHGMQKAEHGTRQSPRKLPEEAQTLAEHLREAGYRTFGVNTNYTLQPRFGFGQGFERFLGERFAFLPYPNLALEAFLPEIRRSSRYFTWLQYFDPHQPYQVHEPWFSSWNESPYADQTEFLLELGRRLYRNKLGLPEGSPFAVRHVDRLQRALMLAEAGPLLGKVYDLLRAVPGKVTADERAYLKAAYRSDVRETDEAMARAFEMLPIDDSTLIIVTADHGEELFDHGGLGHHKALLFQELIHVPLIVRFPGGRGAGRRIETPVSVIDILPTVLEVIGRDVPADIPGVSLLPLVEGRDFPSRQLFAEVNSKNGNARCVIDYPHKLIRYSAMRTPALLDLAADPDETTNVSDILPERLEQLEAALEQWRADTAPRWPDANPANLTAEDLKQLRWMGYVE